MRQARKDWVGEIAELNAPLRFAWSQHGTCDGED